MNAFRLKKISIYCVLTCLLGLGLNNRSQAQYCTPSYTGYGFQNSGSGTAFWTHILNVNMGSINYTTASPQTNPSPVYFNNTFISTDVTPGVT